MQGCVSWCAGCRDTRYRSRICRPPSWMSILLRTSSAHAAEHALNPSALDQTITHGGLGQDVFGLGGIILQFVPQVSHVDAYVMPVVGMRGTPYLTQDLPVRHHLAGIRDEKSQQAVFDGRQIDRGRALAHGAQAHVDGDVAELKDCAVSGAP